MKKNSDEKNMGIINPAIAEAIRQGKYRMDPSALRPAPVIPWPTWTCECGMVNTDPFCARCDAPKPEHLKVWRCRKCGWFPEDLNNPPNFCPECGDPFTDEEKW